MVTITPVQGKRDLMRFIKFPWSIYGATSQWVPPLIMDQKILLSEKNPFYRHSDAQHMLAWRGGRVVGRISAMIDHNYVKHQNEKTGLFGFFECVDDQEVARALFAEAEKWLASRGMTAMLGPTNPSTNDTMGLLIDAFDRPPMVMMPYNHSYYQRLVESVGLEKAADLFAYEIERDTSKRDRISRVAEIVKKRQNVRVEKLDKKRFDEAVGWVKEVWNDAWLDNAFFVPWTDEEIDHLGKDLKPAVDEDLVLFAWKDDEIAGFSIGLPNVYQALIKIRSGRLFPFGLLKLLYYSRKVNEARVAVMGIKRKYRNLGLDAIFYNQTYVSWMKKGIRRGEASWILDTNYSMRNSAAAFGARIYKTYRLYRKDLTSGV